MATRVPAAKASFAACAFGRVAATATEGFRLRAMEVVQEIAADFPDPFVELITVEGVRLAAVF